jgi:hypothetical protein
MIWIWVWFREMSLLGPTLVTLPHRVMTPFAVVAEARTGVPRRRITNATAGPGGATRAATRQATIALNLSAADQTFGDAVFAHAHLGK